MFVVFVVFVVNDEATNQFCHLAGWYAATTHVFHLCLRCMTKRQLIFVALLCLSFSPLSSLGLCLKAVLMVLRQ